MLKKVTLTFAQSLDGQIATAGGESRYISEEGSLKLSQELRRDHDAIAVGIGTALTDNPMLTCRIAPEKNPIRVIFDSSLRLPIDSRIAESSDKIKTLVFYNMATGDAAPAVIEERKKSLESMKIIVMGVSSSADGYLNLSDVLHELGELNIESMMVEGGSAVLTSFLQSGLWTDITLVSAPKFLGRGIPSIGDLGIRTLAEAIKPQVKNIEIIGNEVCWHLSKPDEAKKVSTRTVYFSAPKSINVKDEILKKTDEGQTLYSSRLMAISPGTEKQFYTGNFVLGKKADSLIDCTNQEFSYPFSYGYINIIENTERERFFGFLHHSEKIYACRNDLFPLKDSLDDEAALFLPHMETAVSIIHDTKPKLGDRVLITGAGVIGTLTSRILSGIMGIDTTVFDINPEKGAWFRNNNFCHSRKALEKRDPFDICIDASGSPGGLQTCLECSQTEGSITVASWYGEQEIPLNLGGSFHWKRLKLVSSQVSNMSPSMGRGWNKKRRLNLAADLIEKVQTEDLLTHRFPITEASEAYKLLLNRKALYGLIALVPGG